MGRLGGVEATRIRNRRFPLGRPHQHDVAARTLAGTTLLATLRRGRRPGPRPRRLSRSPGHRTHPVPGPEAWFVGVRFAGRTGFNATSFAEAAFVGTNFSTYVWFNDTVFSGDAGPALFLDATFAAYAGFEDTRINQYRVTALLPRLRDVLQMRVLREPAIVCCSARVGGRPEPHPGTGTSPSSSRVQRESRS